MAPAPTPLPPRGTADTVRPSGGVPDRPGVLGRIAGAAYRRRGRTVLAWVAGLLVAIGLAASFGGEFTADYSAPGSDSKAALTLLEERFPAQSGDTIQVVVETAEGTASTASAAGVTDPAVRAEVEQLLGTLADGAHVASVSDPYAQPGSISTDGRVLVADLRLDVTNPVDMPIADTQELLAVAADAERDGFEVSLGGQAVQTAEQGEIGSEMIGILAAAVILLLTFGSVVAAGLPLVTAIAGLAVSGTLTAVVAAVTDVPDWSTALATMMGIGIGIDYVLLLVTRFREWRAAGLDPERATVATLDTAGRAVLVAGGTVVVSMLGLFAMGLSFMRGAASVTIVAVLVVMVAALTLFPALLGYLGRHVDRLRLPLGRRRQLEVAPGGHVLPSRAWTRWSRLVDRHSIPAALLGLAALLALAAPFLGVRFGFPDAGSDPLERSNRQAYDTVAEAFGPGRNGPLLLAAELETAGDASSLDGLVAELQQTQGVAAVAPPTLNEAGDTAVLTVVPTTGPQDQATQDLVHLLRDEVVPQATEGTGATVYVGGVVASLIDSTDDIASRIPLLIARSRPALDGHPAAGVPQHRDPGRRGVHEPAVRGGGVRDRRAGPRGRLGRAAHRHRDRDTAARVHPRDHVRRPVRALHGLRGLPREPHA